MSNVEFSQFGIWIEPDCTAGPTNVHFDIEGYSLIEQNGSLEDLQDLIEENSEEFQDDGHVLLKRKSVH